MPADDSSLSASELRRRHQIADNSAEFSTSRNKAKAEPTNWLFFAAVGAFVVISAVVHYFMTAPSVRHSEL